MDRVMTEILEKVAQEEGIPIKEVQKIYGAPYLFARKKLAKLDFNNVKSREDFDLIKKSFNFVHLMKLYPNFDNLIHILKNKKK